MHSAAVFMRALLDRLLHPSLGAADGRRPGSSRARGLARLALSPALVMACAALALAPAAPVASASSAS
jgi:hypothetical protein